MTRPPKRKRLTPQQKKALSYARDCRNDFGQNDKAARKAIPLRKAQEHRATRHAAKAALRRDPEHTPLTPTRGWWRKSPDQPLGADLETAHWSDNQHHTPSPFDKTALTPPHVETDRRIRKRVRRVLKGQG